jgi:NADH-quinone oxidoreductase subunit J
MIDILTTVVFYLFAGFTVLSGLMVIASKNPVHSVFFLILAFFNSAGMFLLLGAEYIAMMLDVNFAELRQGFLRYLPLGGAVALAILAELVLAIYTTLQLRSAQAEVSGVSQAEDGVSRMTNTEAIGSLLYTHYVYAFQVAGIILLVAMIGAIVLTLRQRPGVRRQKIDRQVARKRADAMRIIKVKPGQGA